VLDLTRVLAGPVATRFLAGFGADVLRIDPPGWDEPSVIPDVTLGKNCIRLDLHEPGDRAIFERLLAEADVLVHGYRAGALENLSYGSAARQSIRPGLIDVSLNAYGHTGPWAGRRGFDSLVQMSCGIAAAGMGWKQTERPFPLPVQALDHATGYFLAAAVLRGLSARLTDGLALRARLSLARTAKLLMEHRSDPTSEELPGNSSAELCDDIEPTPWGPAQRLRPPAMVENAPMRWDRPAAELGSGAPRWNG
jgi:crotonobetainyl-CoA:carnitine CoA-transferase CaiB-like acyl-CoA transferase